MAESNPACSICLETFKDPVTIPCNHVFCIGCLKRHKEKNAREGIFACPLCNTEVTLTPSAVIGVNENATDDRDVTMKEISPKCDVCGPKIKATSRCPECEENYCHICSVTHIKMKALRNHKLRELGVLSQEEKSALRSSEFCPKHPEEEMKIVCKSCKNIPLCLFCKISEHDSHKSKILSEEVVEIKSALETNMTLCTVRMEQLQTCKKEAEALDSIIDIFEQEEIMNITNQENELIRLLKVQYVEIKKEAEDFKKNVIQVYQKAREENDVCKKQLAKEFSECATLNTETKNLIDTAKESQIVQIGYDLKNNLLEEINRTGTIQLLGMQRKSFTPAAPSKQRLAFEMGYISDNITRKRKMNIFLRSCVKEEPMQLIESEAFEKISELRNKVIEKYSLLPNTKLVLKFGERELTDYDGSKSGWNEKIYENTVRRYGISNGSIIDCYWSEPS